MRLKPPNTRLNGDGKLSPVPPKSRAAAGQARKFAHALDRLRRLRGDAEARALAELRYVRLSQHHVELGQVFGQAAHFHVLALADDDGMKALTDEFGDGAVRDVDERTR